MKRYRITKYNPIHRDHDGFYKKDEWTSWADLGKIYNDRKFCINDYLFAENKYIDVVKELLNINNIQELYIIDLEVSQIDYLIDEMSKEKLYLSKYDMQILKRIINGKKTVDLNEIPGLFRLLLREIIWCRLLKKKQFEIEIGYDFYMYVVCDEISEKMIEDQKKLAYI